ncbi:MAG: SDR family oxidoreductase [Halobacteriovoraceae bacterium]|jgi:NAD(P)-dependent dehydrogenase (short-subunit alcohol dehydrogenase family)|nr:SDR family oxidoreductase [Halobacteriovoraceae bacterium]
MKITLVTGANRGLGLEASTQLAMKGHKVYMACRDLEKGEFSVKSLQQKGLNVELIKMDVTKTKDIRNFSSRLKENNEQLDVLINNAGVFLESLGPEDQTTASILKVDPVIILKTIETNTIGPLKLIQSLLPLMMDHGGRIINISSGMGKLDDMGGLWPGYRMSKTALNALTKIVASEMKDKKISVNSVCPGWVRTDMGGKNAHLSLAQGVETIVWLATCDNPPSGKFLRDKKEISW